MPHFIGSVIAGLNALGRLVGIARIRRRIMGSLKSSETTKFARDGAVMGLILGLLASELCFEPAP
jgi:hypothetical protein